MQHVTAISAMGHAIDGATRKRPPRAKTTSRPAAVAGSWVCPACGRRTDDAEDQAKHLAAEVFALSNLLAEVQADAVDIEQSLPDYGRRVEAARLALSDDAARRGRAAAVRLRRAGLVIPHPVWLAEREYHRRHMRQSRQKRAAEWAS